MASQKEIKSRIGSIKNIQKITRAMEMVSAGRGGPAPPPNP
ncbi:MAG: F0F1 ATP synthase subunit gamma, partial [Thermoleophilaceae bacterium]|nr:F0F1 ATP synthase subunit gamma [Thermoleophilaceae bacterium]